MVKQAGAALFFQAFPCAVIGYLHTLFISHLQKEEIGKLFNIIAIVNTIMAQGMTESPEFVYYVGHLLFSFMNEPPISSISIIFHLRPLRLCLCREVNE